MARVQSVRREQLAPFPHAITPEIRARLCEEAQDIVNAQVTRLKKVLPAHLERDDLAQEGQIGLLKAIDSYNPDSHIPFRVWAHFKIRGAILDAFRRRRYTAEMHPGLDDAPEQSAEPDAEEATLHREQVERIRLALRSLPAGERRAVRTLLSGRFLADAGKREGVCAVTICTRRQKGLALLREYMKGRDLTAADLLP